MTYPIIRWSGGGGGMLPGVPATVRLGSTQILPLVVSPASTAIAASFFAAHSAAGTDTTADEPSVTPPSEATVARCRCLVESAGDVDAAVAASAIEACAADPDGFVSAMSAAGLDTSACSGSGASAGGPLWQNPWVIGGAAALVLGGLAVVALR